MSVLIGNITINQNPEQEGEAFTKTRIGQSSQRMEDGQWLTYDSGRTIVNGVLVLDQVIQSEADALRDYITNTLLFKKFSFAITPPSFWDCGAGDGVEVTNCTLDTPDASTQGIFTQIGRLRRYKITLPYTYTIQPQIGEVDGEGVIV